MACSKSNEKAFEYYLDEIKKAIKSEDKYVSISLERDKYIKGIDENGFSVSGQAGELKFKISIFDVIKND